MDKAQGLPVASSYFITIKIAAYKFCDVTWDLAVATELQLN